MNIKKIGIAGAGGIGSNLTAILYDYGFNRKQFDYSSVDIDVYDDDIVDLKNLLNQNFKTDDVGRHKVKVLEDSYVVNPFTRFMEEKDFKNYDVIFSCVDGMEFRKALYEYGYKNSKLFWIDGRCTSRTGAVFNSSMSKEELDSLIDNSKERKGCLYDREKAQDLSHTTPLTVASVMVQVFLNHLRGIATERKLFMI